MTPFVRVGGRGGRYGDPLQIPELSGGFQRVLVHPGIFRTNITQKLKDKDKQYPRR